MGLIYDVKTPLVAIGSSLVQLCFVYKDHLDTGVDSLINHKLKSPCTSFMSGISLAQEGLVLCPDPAHAQSRVLARKLIYCIA